MTAVDSLTRRTDIHSVEEFLAALPESLRAHSVLMFETRSPQVASYEAPRAILFGEDARYVVGFSGRSDAVDLMSFDEERQSFVFREVTFPEAAGVRTMHVSEANPERCRACHGTPARPVWDAYPSWPGAYGENAFAPPSAEERAGYARFERGARTHRRYRYLPPRRETAIEAAERRYQGARERANNAEFGEVLSALQAKAVAAELRASPNFERTRYALLYALAARCRGAGGSPWLGSDAEDAAGYASFAADAERANREQAMAKRSRAHGGEASRAIAAADSTAMTRLRYVAERDLGVSTETWTLALEKGTYDFLVSNRPTATFERHLFVEIAGPGERAVELQANASDERSVCASLEGHLRDAAPFGALPPVAWSHWPAHAPTLIERCADCHDRGVGPAIPFAHPEELARALRLPAASGRSLLEETRLRLGPEAGAKRMPLGFLASADDRAKLLSTLDELVREKP